MRARSSEAERRRRVYLLRRGWCNSHRNANSAGPTPFRVLQRPWRLTRIEWEALHKPTPWEMHRAKKSAVWQRSVRGQEMCEGRPLHTTNELIILLSASFWLQRTSKSEAANAKSLKANRRPAAVCGAAGCCGHLPQQLPTEQPDQPDLQLYSSEGGYICAYQMCLTPLSPVNPSHYRSDTTSNAPS